MLSLTFLVILLGTALGIILAIMKISPLRPLSLTSSVFIEIFRDLPVVVLLIWFFYFLPLYFNRMVSPFVVSVIALSLYLGAFSAEIFRAGFVSIHKGQIEAAHVLKLSSVQTFWHIIVPLSLKVILPPLAGRYIDTIKTTSLASFITVNELFFQGQNIISQTYRPLEVYTVIGVLYLIIILPLSLLLQRWEHARNKATL
ncbi:amino acid ABC transporter permease [Candidatus Woesearchaeota archaeon]|nr:amino acid ABC transporter permease [Candidatus Woesearchaeota archaeon]HIH38995.1 amino acid ABC transporter permease [Candidatus Woesearchaeota archaeon]HIH48794.1 amino acid ABC transporter permease [Candidatus Woesearchaeota archaeon]HIJ04087.1 amino acid ABC transporter permease [Candidatus Woesearchaeota archaeon]